MILQIKFLKKYFVKIELNQNLTVNTAFHINKRPLNLYSGSIINVGVANRLPGIFL